MTDDFLRYNSSVESHGGNIDDGKNMTDSETIDGHFYSIRNGTFGNGNNFSFGKIRDVEQRSSDKLKNTTFGEVTNNNISGKVYKGSSVVADALVDDETSTTTDEEIIEVTRNNTDNQTILENEEEPHFTTTDRVLDLNEDTLDKITTTIEDLSRTLNQTTSTFPRDSVDVLAALRSFGAALPQLALPPAGAPVATPTLAVFPAVDGVHSVYMGTAWRRWNIAVPTAGVIAVRHPLSKAASLDQVVGVVVNSTLGRAALAASPWVTVVVDSILFGTRYAHSRTVDVFLYAAEGDADEGDAVEAFWEPFSSAWSEPRCAAWTAGAWDGGFCEAFAHSATLAGCRCRGAVFVDGVVRRARILVSEESATIEKLADVTSFRRASATVNKQLHSEDRSDRRDVGRVVNHMLTLKPDLFARPDAAMADLLLDVGVAVHNAAVPHDADVFLAVGDRATLVVARRRDGDARPPGVAVAKRWPSDDPDAAAFTADLGDLGDMGDLGDLADTELFVVRPSGKASASPRRASLVLTAWDTYTLHQFFFRVVFFTSRVADLVFSPDADADADADDVDVIFETASRDWTDVTCAAWNFTSSTWHDAGCTARNVTRRLHACRCPDAVHSAAGVHRARIALHEHSVNRQSYAACDAFERATRRFATLATAAQPTSRLSDLVTFLDVHVLRNVRVVEFALPPPLLDHLAALLQRLDLGADAVAVASSASAKTMAILFVQEVGSDGALPSVGVAATHGRVVTAPDEARGEFDVVVGFRSPPVGVGRVAVVLVATTSRIRVEDRVIHRDKRYVDVSCQQATPQSDSVRDVDVSLKPFVATTRPTTVRSKTCHYWDFGRRVWVGGCTVGVEGGRDRCRCSMPVAHDNATGRARFLIASDWSEQTVIHSSVPFFMLLTSELSVQMVIFHTGCALSLFGLVTVFVTALAFKSWRQPLSNRILLHICSALLLQILSVLFYFVVYHPLFFAFFDFVPHHRQWTYLCLAMGVVWSYSYLARWCWMLVMSLLQLMRIVTVMGARNVPNLVRKVSIFAWGGPFLVLGYFLSKPWAYFDDFNRRFYFLTYLLPLSVVLVANLAVFAAILARAFACCGWGKMADLERHGADTWLSVWKRLRTVIVLFFTLEMTWLFELFIYFGYYNGFMHFMSFLVTSFHGFGTFVVFVAMDRDAQAGWRAALRSWRSWRKIALLYCAVLALIGLALALVVGLAVLLVCLHTLF